MMGMKISKIYIILENNKIWGARDTRKNAEQFIKCISEYKVEEIYFFGNAEERKKVKEKMTEERKKVKERMTIVETHFFHPSTNL